MHLTLENLHMYCTEEGDCLLWNLCVTSEGRPSARLDGKVRDVARYVYTLRHGPIPKGMVVAQRCRNYRCLECLEAITHTEKNIRNVGRRSLGMYGTASLVAQGRIKLDMEKARAIRSSDKASVDLAREYGVHRTTICDVRLGRIWRERAMSVFNQ